MNSSRKVILSVCAMMLAVSLPGWCQQYGANVNEGLETAELYVDVANGSDSNPGTASQPLQHIATAAGIAVTNNQNNIGTRVIINPGVYREVVSLNSTPNMTNVPMTFEAAINGTVMVSGAQQWTGWKPYSANNNIYTNPWPYAWGLCTPGSQATPWPNIVMRREMVFVEGRLLTQVMSLNEMTVSTYYVDETGGTLYVWPPSGINIYAADVEVSVNPTVWTITGFSNVVVRGMTFEYANSCRENGAVLVEGPTNNPVSNVLFDTDSFLWNNSQGLNFQPVLTEMTVQNSIANHNGEAGFQGSHSNYVVFQNNAASYNNWRGGWGAYYNYNSSGAHFYEMHEMELIDLGLYYNLTYGMHFDTDHQNITVNGMVASENYLSGNLIERNEGPFDISYSYYCNGNPVSSTLSNLGMQVRDSEYVTANNDYYVNNAAGDVYVNGITGGYQVTNWESNQTTTVVSSNLTLTNDVLEAGAGQTLFFDGYVWDWPYFQPTFTSNYNTWWDGANSQPFTIVSGNGTENVNFAGFQAATGQDQASVWAEPAGNLDSGCMQEPDMVDYWFITPFDLGEQTINAGSSAVWPVSIFPLRFQGNVTLSYDVSMVPGATASYGTNVLTPNGTTNFTVQTSSTTPAGTYQVVMLANSGSMTKEMTVLLVVQ
jgi:hypothetical protein